MRILEWRQSHAVFVTEMDDEHAEIVEALAAFQQTLAARPPRSVIEKSSESLLNRLDDHCAHEERLMRAARYPSYRWHKVLHDNARRRVRQFVERLQSGDAVAASELRQYLSSWLDDHTRVADMMLGAFLRNHRRGLCKVVFEVGTKPADSCDWVDSRGDKFDPRKTGRQD